MAAVFEEDARLRAPTIGIEAEMIGAKKLLEGGLLVTADGAMFQAMTVTTRAGAVSVKLMGGPGGAASAARIAAYGRERTGVGGRLRGTTTMRGGFALCERSTPAALKLRIGTLLSPCLRERYLSSG